MAKDFTSTAQWRRLRLKILERDGYQCQIRGPNCDGKATDVDHKIPVPDGGETFDPVNLRAACHRCNSWRANMQKAKQGWRRSNTHIVLVLGPDASKYAADHAKPGDLVLDYTVLAESLGDAAKAAYDSVMTRIRRGEVKARTAYIVSHHPDARNMFPYHEIVGEEHAEPSTKGLVRPYVGTVTHIPHGIVAREAFLQEGCDYRGKACSKSAMHVPRTSTSSS